MYGAHARIRFSLCVVTEHWVRDDMIDLQRGDAFPCRRTDEIQPLHQFYLYQQIPCSSGMVITLVSASYPR